MARNRLYWKFKCRQCLFAFFGSYFISPLPFMSLAMPCILPYPPSVYCHSLLCRATSIAAVLAGDMIFLSAFPSEPSGALTGDLQYTPAYALLKGQCFCAPVHTSACDGTSSLCHINIGCMHVCAHSGSLSLISSH